MASHLVHILATVTTPRKEDDIRRLALEVLVSFAESCAKAVPPSSGYMEKVLELSVGFILSLDGNLKAWRCRYVDRPLNFPTGGGGRCLLEVLSRPQIFPQAPAVQSLKHVRKTLPP